MPHLSPNKSTWLDGFSKSKMVLIYTQELAWLTYQIQRKWEQIHSKHPSPPKRRYFSADVETLEFAYSILTDAAKVCELLMPQNKKSIYWERAEYLNDLLKSINIVSLKDKKLRNTLEHFAEYLDDHNYIHSTFKPTKKYHIAFNLVFSHMAESQDSAFPFHVYVSPIDKSTVVFPVRVFVVETGLLHNLSWAANIRSIVDEANQIYSEIKKTTKMERPEDWVSGLIPIEPAT